MTARVFYGIQIMTVPSSKPVSEFSDYQFGDSVGYLISRVSAKLWNMGTQRTMPELGITSAQGSVLFMVASGKCTTAAELAREYGIDASAATRLVDRLEKRGLLTRLRCSKDRRIVRLAVTPEGSAIAEQMPAIFAGVREQLLSGFTPEEVGFLKSMLRRALINGGG
ncbi:DNA-binding MarR family transcriptional regulator [Paraburkholderia sp. EB58]|jgi:DNA-binding MarR family transcriptional regulator